MNPVAGVIRAAQFGWNIGQAINPYVQPYVASGLAAVFGDPTAIAANSDKAEQCGPILKPAIPDTESHDLCEQLALAEAKPGAGSPRMGAMGDEPRLVAHYGAGPWVKMHHEHRCPNGRLVVIHYFTNTRGKNVELKSK